MQELSKKEQLTQLQHFSEQAINDPELLLKVSQSSKESLKDAIIKNDQSEQAVSYLTLGVALSELGFYDKALSNLFKALYLYKEAENKIQTCNTLIAMGTAYCRMENHLNAVACLEEAFLDAEIISDDSLSGTILTNMGICHRLQENYEEAFRYFNLALQKRQPSTVEYACVLYNLADMYRERQDYSQALSGFDKAQEQLPPAEEFSEGQILRGKAKTYYQMQDYRNNGKELQKALEIAQSIDSPILLCYIFRDMHDHYLALKDMQQAYYCYKKYYQLKNTLTEEENRYKISEIKSHFELEIKEKESEIYKLRTDELQKAVNESKAAYNLLEKTQTSLVNMERKNTALAMAVKASEDLTMPLQNIGYAIRSIGAKLKEPKEASVETKLQAMNDAVLRIEKILARLRNIDVPMFKSYVAKHKMLDF